MGPPKKPARRTASSPTSSLRRSRSTSSVIPRANDQESLPITIEATSSSCTEPSSTIATAPALSPPSGNLRRSSRQSVKPGRTPKPLTSRSSNGKGKRREVVADPKSRKELERTQDAQPALNGQAEVEEEQHIEHTPPDPAPPRKSKRKSDVRSGSGEEEDEGGGKVRGDALGDERSVKRKVDEGPQEAGQTDVEMASTSIEPIATAASDATGESSLPPDPATETEIPTTSLVSANLPDEPIVPISQLADGLPQAEVAIDETIEPESARLAREQEASREGPGKLLSESVVAALAQETLNREYQPTPAKDQAAMAEEQGPMTGTSASAKVLSKSVMAGLASETLNTEYHSSPAKDEKIEAGDKVTEEQEPAGNGPTRLLSESVMDALAQETLNTEYQPTPGNLQGKQDSDPRPGDAAEATDVAVAEDAGSQSNEVGLVSNHLDETETLLQDLHTIGEEVSQHASWEHFERGHSSQPSYQAVMDAQDSHEFQQMDTGQSELAPVRAEVEAEATELPLSAIEVPNVPVLQVQDLVRSSQLSSRSVDHCKTEEALVEQQTPSAEHFSVVESEPVISTAASFHEETNLAVDAARATSAETAPTPVPAQRTDQTLFEDLDGVDFADVELTPPTSNHDQCFSSQPDPSPAARQFERVMSRRSAFDQFDNDIADDVGFWDEVFDGEFVAAAKSPRAGEQQHDEFDEHFDDDIDQAIPASTPPNFQVGFSTASNRRLAAPSDQAIARVMKRIGETSSKGDGEVESDILKMAASKRAALAKAKAVEAASAPAQQNQAEHQDEFVDEEPPALVGDGPIPATVSFQKANGLPVKLDKAGLEAAEERLAQWEAEHSREDATSKHSTPRPSTPLPSTMLPPAARIAQTRSPLSALPMGSARVNSSENSTPATSTTSRMENKNELPPAPTFTSTLIAARPSLPSTASAPALPTSTPPSTSTSGRSQAGPFATPVRPPVISRATGPSPVMRQTLVESRAPLDGRTTRISLGMTPKPKLAAGLSKPVFRTPFKSNGQSYRSETPSRSLAAVSPAGELHAHRIYPASSGSPMVTSAAKPIYPRPSITSLKSSLAPTTSDPSVFDLRCLEARHSLDKHGLRPRRLTVGSSAECEVTILNNPAMAERFVFEPSEGVTLGPKDALRCLRDAGATRVDMKWVLNHWILISWKLAAYAVIKPDEGERWWCFDEVCRQMKYRYEREVNLAQRSAIKRIAEHDSPPNLPMVLCVFNIRKDPGQGNKSTAYMLELTDGWYRILANIDEPMARAVKRNKIRRGVKLVIQGATLDASSSGPCDALEAGSKIVLNLAGNSCSLARWDARLGFQKGLPPAASLRSLTPDGGIISCMDIVVTRLFPVAFVDVGSSGNQMGGARGEAEEAEAQRAWETKREECQERLEESAKQAMVTIDKVCDLLASYAEVVPAAGQRDDDDEDAETFLELLLDASAPGPLLSSALSRNPRLFPELYRLASVRAEALRSDAHQQLQQSLNETCPPRKVRSFRICKFADAASLAGEGQQANGVQPLRRPCKRTVQLTIWDVANLSSESSGTTTTTSTIRGPGQNSGSITLEEGRRYRVSNLIPTSRSAWRGPDKEADAFLATRRDSLWWGPL